MNRVRLFFSIFLLLSFFPGLRGQEMPSTNTLQQFDHVFITLHNGTQYSVAIDTTSQIKSFTDDDGVRKVCVYGKTQSFLFDSQEIKILTCKGGEAMSIQQLQSYDRHDIGIWRNGEDVCFSQSLSGVTAIVSDLSGRRVASFVITSTSPFSLQSLSQGIYLITAGRFTLKVQKL